MKIALWQCEQKSGDVAGNLRRLERAAREAATAGADLLVTPEMFLTGYAIGSDAVQRLAEPVDGPSARAAAALAASAGLAMVWGYPERAADGRVFNAVQWVDARGEVRGNYRKIHLFGDRDRAQFAPSDGACRVFEADGCRVGMLICYDVEFPEAVRRLALQGADLVVVPTANMQGFDAVARVLVPARACENQLVVAYANCCGCEADLVYDGRSTVALPDGSVAAVADGRPALLYADVDLTQNRQSRRALLRDRRPDTYGDLVSTDSR
ncbi:MAG: carbon-nitrogen hydrolase family protein [Pseudomonadota bacterium]|nr:carbon-nitrogen hydrolase family protein [Pseudomonadota bacterium]